MITLKEIVIRSANEGDILISVEFIHEEEQEEKNIVYFKNNEVNSISTIKIQEETFQFDTSDGENLYKIGITGNKEKTFSIHFLSNYGRSSKVYGDNMLGDPIEFTAPPGSCIIKLKAQYSENNGFLSQVLTQQVSFKALQAIEFDIQDGDLKKVEFLRRPSKKLENVFKLNHMEGEIINRVDTSVGPGRVAYRFFTNKGKISKCYGIPSAEFFTTTVPRGTQLYGWGNLAGILFNGIIILPVENALSTINDVILNPTSKDTNGNSIEEKYLTGDLIVLDSRTNEQLWYQICLKAQRLQHLHVFFTEKKEIPLKPLFKAQYMETLRDLFLRGFLITTNIFHSRLRYLLKSCTALESFRLSSLSEVDEKQVALYYGTLRHISQTILAKSDKEVKLGFKYSSIFVGITRQQFTFKASEHELLMKVDDRYKRALMAYFIRLPYKLSTFHFQKEILSSFGELEAKLWKRVVIPSVCYRD